MGTYVPGTATERQYPANFSIVAAGTFASTATGAFSANTNQTVVLSITGVALGDQVQVSLSVSQAGVTLSAYVNAAGSVTVAYDPGNNTPTLGAHNIILIVERLQPELL